MVKPATFVLGDLVFAKVKGFPAWPARIVANRPGAKFKVFFYGTYEVADIKKNDIWPYTPENKAKFGPPNIKRKGYSEGLQQIENEPDIAGVESDDVPLGNIPDTASPAVVIKKPLKLEDGTPVSPKKPVKRAPEDTDSPSVAAKAKKEDEPVATPASTPNTVSRSGRVIKPKKFGDDSSQADQGNKVADNIIEEPRKVWVKLKSSGDLVEINLDRDKPER